MAGSVAYNGSGDMIVAGNLRVGIGVLTASDGSGEAVATGFKNIIGVSVTPSSAASAAYCSNWTKSAGNLTPGTCTSGDDFEVVIWGV